MWEFSGEPDEPRFLAIADSDHDQRAPVPWHPLAPAALGVELRERLIVYGALTEPESGETVASPWRCRHPIGTRRRRSYGPALAGSKPFIPSKYTIGSSAAVADVARRPAQLCISLLQGPLLQIGVYGDG